MRPAEPATIEKASLFYDNERCCYFVSLSLQYDSGFYQCWETAYNTISEATQVATMMGSTIDKSLDLFEKDVSTFLTSVMTGAKIIVLRAFSDGEIEGFQSLDGRTYDHRALRRAIFNKDLPDALSERRIDLAARITRLRQEAERLTEKFGSLRDDYHQIPAAWWEDK